MAPAGIVVCEEEVGGGDEEGIEKKGGEARLDLAEIKIARPWDERIEPLRCAH